MIMESNWTKHEVILGFTHIIKVFLINPNRVDILPHHLASNPDGQPTVNRR